MRFRFTVKLLSGAALALAAETASAMSVTYDFTGSTDEEAGVFAPLPPGSSVTGSFTINLDAAIPAQGSGDVNSTSWQRAAAGGTQANNTPPPAGFVFSGSFSVNGAAAYTTGPISPILTGSAIDGFSSGFLSAGVSVQPTSSPFTDFHITLASGSNALEPWLSNGLPNLDVINLANSNGFLEAGAGLPDQLEFVLTSVTAASVVPPGGTPVPTPVPAALWLCISGLGLLSRMMTSTSRD